MLFQKRSNDTSAHDEDAFQYWSSLLKNVMQPSKEGGFAAVGFLRYRQQSELTHKSMKSSQNWHTSLWKAVRIDTQVYEKRSELTHKSMKSS